MGERGVGVRLRERAEAGAVLVAPVAPERPRSTLDWFTKVLRSVEVLGPVGLLEPPQPLRELSISIPIVLGNPALTRLLYIASV